MLAYSGTWVNQQWPYNAETPHGAFEFPEHLIADSPIKPIRIWMEVGDRDLFNPNVMNDHMHDWVAAKMRPWRRHSPQRATTTSSSLQRTPAT